MHGYGMVGDLLHLALYLLSIGFWAFFWIVCMFNAKRGLKRRLGAHALLIGLLFFPVLPATVVGGALIAFGIESLVWSLCIAGVGLPLAGLGFVRRYA
ncbi:hypothetical protein DKY63_31315 [Pseudomonas putida]|uniref:Uncharacterized protein n=1 Tax=Pseudomonas putida TaxID=303 RepID=A0A2Z4RSJ6_PSEPU|nr:hypothetical protein [Pseudomonas putida]AWY44161.1 hypothetical protein DKY63_31315 [Pseudomonas putida]